MSTSVNKQPPAYPEAAWPTDTFFDELHKLPEYMNGEAVIVYHAPAATTDADSLVFFRHSEVIHAGSLFSTVGYPVIDLEKGGTIQGVIDGLNHILDLAVAEVPGTGRDLDHPEPRPAVGHRRRRLLSQHAGDDSRPGAGPEEEGADAGAGESSEAHARLRRSLRRDRRPLDHRTCSWTRSTALSRRSSHDTRSAGFAGALATRGGAWRRDGQSVRALITSYGATYDTSREIRLEGKLVQFAFRNPHRSSTCRRRTRTARRSGGRWNGAARRSWPTTASPATRSTWATAW
jgi:hypothetical protein